jgi:hypothetical protein
MKKTIIYDSNLVIIDVDPSESDEIISERVNFIIKNKDKYKDKDKNKEDYNKLIILSKLYCNKKYNKLEYPNDLN